MAEFSRERVVIGLVGGCSQDELFAGTKERCFCDRFN